MLVENYAVWQALGCSDREILENVGEGFSVWEVAQDHGLMGMLRRLGYEPPQS